MEKNILASMPSWMTLAIVALASITALLRLASEWLRYKTQAAAVPPKSTSTSTNQHALSLWGRMSRLERAHAVSWFLVAMFSLLAFIAIFALVFIAPATPASSRDVALIAFLLAMIIIGTKPPPW
jgi:hypothetical protein